jgi:hypothetical protein
MVQLKGVKNAYMLFFKKKKKTWLTFLDNDVAHQIKKSVSNINVAGEAWLHNTVVSLCDRPG